MVDIETDTQDGNLVPWHTCHNGDVVAADINVDKQQVRLTLKAVACCIHRGTVSALQLSQI